MAYDEELAERIKSQLKGVKGLAAKKMFGGVAFLLHGNMCVGVHKDSLIVRLDPAETDTALREKDTRVFDLSGRPMKGWILVDPGGVRTTPGLARWVKQAKSFAATLPRKA